IDCEENHPYLKEQLTLEFEKRTMAEWETYLKGKDTCVTPILNFAEACDAEQTKANEMVLTVNDEELGEYKQIGFAMKLSKTPAQLSKRAPRLGEDNKEILGED
ncbi:MAG: CoA transferase, partial [Phascolarctobacterium sp.]|nr:CoA transferase [Phascolarctobacterium sp.]